MNELTLTVRRTQLAELRRQIEGNRKVIDGTLETLAGLIDVSEGRTWIVAIRQARGRYAISSAKMLRLMEEDRPEDAAALMNDEILPALEALQSPLKKLLESQKQFAAGHAGINQKIDFALTMMAVLEGAPSGLWQSALDDS